MNNPLDREIVHVRDESFAVFVKMDSRASPFAGLVMNIVSSAFTAAACLKLTPIMQEAIWSWGRCHITRITLML